jgi:hypothetical protein
MTKPMIDLPIPNIGLIETNLTDIELRYYASLFNQEPQWHLDLFSTILSRKHSYHKRIGKQLYVKTKKEVKNCQKLL